MMNKCFYQVASNHEYTNSNVMIAANSGDFNIAEGEELLQGISVVSAIYQLTKKDGLDKIDNKGYFNKNRYSQHLKLTFKRFLRFHYPKNTYSIYGGKVTTFYYNSLSLQMLNKNK